MGGIYWLASYPKSGNTWLSIFLSNLIADDDKPIDINCLKTGHIASARNWLDDALAFDTADLLPGEILRVRPEVYRWSSRNPAPSYHKIHDAYITNDADTPIVPPEATLGALYIIRNPLDVAPSAANHWHCSVDEAIERMGRHDAALSITGRRLAAQVEQSMLTWSEHVLSWVDAPGLNCHVVRYEDMLDHPLATFGAIAAFLELPASADKLNKAIRFSSFAELSQQEKEKGFRCRPQQSERFFRHGKKNTWQETLTPQQIERIVADHNAVMARYGYFV